MRIITKETGIPESKYSLKKGERLSGHIRISSLFESGKRSDCFPLRLVFQYVDKEQYPVSVAVIVSKRLIRKAAERNLIKRRIREIYRNHKPRIHVSNKSLHMLIQYRSDKIADYWAIERAYLNALASMKKQIDLQVNE